MSQRASAARYARALLDITTRDTEAVRAESDLSAFLTLLETHDALRRALTSPVVPAAGKRAVVRRLVDVLGPSPAVGKLLALLAERDRLALLADLLEVYRERLRERQKVVRAEVTSAAPLAAGRVDEMQRRLSAATGRTVLLTASVDPAIVGGLVTRIGNMVYDGSLRTQLRTVRQRLERNQPRGSAP
jgi:F-type H+-transporting ATPase subunit delta